MKLRNCRVCGKKGIKFASDGCKFCGADWVTDTQWQLAKEKGLTDGKILRNISNSEKIFRSTKENFFPSMKFLGVLAIIISIIYFAIFYNPDPFVYGCVYEKTYGSKIKCVEYKYNERKEPGSYDRAFKLCMSSLNQIGRSTVKDYEIDGCLDSGGP